MLERGGSSLDAVSAAVRVLEDDPLFNAGRGAVLNQRRRRGARRLHHGRQDPRAGAVTGLRHVKNPIELARLVMEQSPHVMLVGEGAEEFALEQGVELVPNDYFRTARPHHAARRGQARRGGPRQRRHAPGHRHRGRGGARPQRQPRRRHLHRGHDAASAAAASATRRIIGAGTYASNESCAVSATGDGEYFIRTVVAHDICAQVEYQHEPLEQAVNEVLHGKLTPPAARAA